MVTFTIPYTTPERQALSRAARGELERALDGLGWPWSRRLSSWLDCLLTIEEGAS